MKRSFGLVAPLLAVATLAVASVASGCGGSPDDAFRAFAAAAERGDEEQMLARLTRPSRLAVRGILAASQAARPMLAPERLTERVRVVASTVRGDDAEIDVVAEDGTVLPVFLAREEGSWRIDLLECERRWSRLRLERELDSPNKLR